MMSKCIVCSGTDIKDLYTEILKCHGCGYVFADLNLGDEGFAEIYSSKYFSGEEYCNYIADREILSKNFSARMKVLRKFLDPIRHKTLLEIGSAYGFFLELVQDQFSSVEGIDISEEATRYAREVLNLNVVQADPARFDFGNKKFDVVCLWDTIEHLKSPDLCLEKINRHTDSGALLALTTGDIESLNARMQKSKWRLIHPPTHAHYFSKKTLVRFLQQFGFDVIYSRYCGFYRSLENIAYNILVLRKKSPALYKLLSERKFLRLNLYLNLYDIMYVIARKQ